MRFSLAVAAVALLASCGSEAVGPTDDGATRSPAAAAAPRPPGTSFEAEIQVEGDRLRVRWTLVNGGDTGLLVPDGVPRRGSGFPDDDRTRGYVTPGAGGIEVSQRLFAWPDKGKTLATPPTVGVTRVAPDETLSRQVVLDPPFAVHHPFGTDLGDGPLTLPEPPTVVTFCLGVLAPPFHPSLVLTEADGVETVRHGNVQFEAQHVFCSEPHEV